MKKKDVFTTGQVAQICSVAPRTVTKWFDSGQLKGYRIPGSRDRRIPLHQLIKFMQSHNIPTDELDCGRLKILIIDANRESATEIADSIKSDPKYDVHYASTGFEAGLLAQKVVPNVIIISLLSSEIDAISISKTVHTDPQLQGTKILAMADKINKSDSEILISRGFDGCIQDKDDITGIIRSVEKASCILS